MTDSLVPTNTPEDVLKRMKIKEALLRGDDLKNENLEEPSYDSKLQEFNDQFKEVPIGVQVPHPGPRPEEIKKRGYKLTLKHSLYKVTFDIQDLSISDFQLAVKVPKSDFRFEPQPNSRFVLDCMGESYNVVYLGGLFDFSSDSSWSITFMLETEEDDNTWTPDT